MTTEMTAERRRYLLRATEDMVTAHRIEAITREHASIANLLDQREIFELDEIQIKQGKFVKIEADSRIQSRRGARAETEIKPVATQAVESFKEKGINVQLLSGGFDMELRVWKEKSSKPACRTAQVSVPGTGRLLTQNDQGTENGIQAEGGCRHYQIGRQVS